MEYHIGESNLVLTHYIKNLRKNNFYIRKVCENTHYTLI